VRHIKRQKLIQLTRFREFNTQFFLYSRLLLDEINFRRYSRSILFAAEISRMNKSATETKSVTLDNV